jgi:hypothetical protein
LFDTEHEANLALKQYENAEVTPDIILMNRVILRRLRDIYQTFPLKPFISPSSSGSITPTPSSISNNKVNTPEIDNSNLPITGSISPNLKSQVMDNSNLPLDNPFGD